MAKHQYDVNAFPTEAACANNFEKRTSNPTLIVCSSMKRARSVAKWVATPFKIRVVCACAP